MRLACAVFVGFLLLPGTSLAQTQNSLASRIDLDVNFGGTSFSSKERTFQSRFVKSSEAGSSSAAYPEPSLATLFDVGGRFRLNQFVGVGASYSRAKSEDAVGLITTIPHPTFFNSPATGSGTSGTLTRTEGATNVSLSFVVPLRTNRVALWINTGPTFFSFHADLVNAVSYTQTYTTSSPQQTVTVTGATTSPVEASTVGFHLGTEATFFLTELFGIGGGVRFSDGKVTIDQEPLSQVTQEFRVGGMSAFGGVRFRLPQGR